MNVRDVQARQSSNKRPIRGGCQEIDSFSKNAGIIRFMLQSYWGRKLCVRLRAFAIEGRRSSEENNGVPCGEWKEPEP
jgi:hypothetical protein